MMKYADNTTVTMGEARTDFGFKSMVVYCSPCQLNALDVEAKIQRLLHKLPLGIRLWRAVAKGGENKFTPAKYKVFIAYSRTVRSEYGKTLKIVP